MPDGGDHAVSRIAQAGSVPGRKPLSAPTSQLKYFNRVEQVCGS
jgi:hypothetical protein